MNETLILWCKWNPAHGKCKGRLDSEVRPGGIRNYGSREARWDETTQSVIPVAPQEIVKVELPIMPEDYQIEIDFGGEARTFWARDIRHELVQGEA